MKKRIPFFDIARGLSAFYIIILWHNINYYSNSLIGIRAPITIAALACFTFMSGLFNGSRNAKPKDFYLNRFKRLYIPFAIAYVLLLLIHFNVFSIKSSILSLLGISVFFKQYSPQTLWYVCMLLVFYAITPFLVNIKYEANSLKISRYIKWGGVFLAFCILYLTLPNVDIRVPIYSTFYIAGIAFTPTSLAYYFSNTKNCVILFLVTGLLFFSIAGVYGERIYLYVIYGILGIVSLLSLSGVLSNVRVLCKIFEFLAYSSMFAYLFHRFFNFIFISIIPNPYIEYIVMSLTIFPISYFLQRFYDSLLKSK